jgi:hypothetical protein
VTKIVFLEVSAQHQIKQYIACIVYKCSSMQFFYLSKFMPIKGHNVSIAYETVNWIGMQLYQRTREDTF